MTIFPSLIPASRDLTGGQWTATDHRILTGAVATVISDLTERGRGVTATFGPVGQDAWEQILTHFREHDVSQGFEFNSITIPTALTPAGFYWRWAQMPQVSDPYDNMRMVGCEFLLVPIVHRSFGGEQLTALFEILGQSVPEPPSPPPAHFGGERLSATMQLERRSSARAPGHALAIFQATGGQTVTGQVVLPGAAVTILGWATNRAGWLRLFGSAAGAAADAGRPQNQPPQEGRQLIIDPAQQAPGVFAFDTPDSGFNGETPRSNLYPFRFTNYGDAGEVRIEIIFSGVASTWL